MKKILKMYNSGQITENDAVFAMTKHILSKSLSSYLTNELLNMVYGWHMGKIPTWQLEKIA